jgi:putative permease
MSEVHWKWYDRRFFPLLLIIFAFLVLYSLHLWPDVMAPLWAALIMAYLLNPVVQAAERWRVPRSLSVGVLVGGLLCVGCAFVFGIAPEIWRQAQAFVTAMPSMVVKGQGYLASLPDLLPGLVTAEQIERLVQTLEQQLLGVFDDVLAVSLSGVKGIFQFLAYAIIVPMMVFFLLKDHQQLLAGIRPWFAKDAVFWAEVWHELDKQWLGYLRGKIIECLLMSIACYLLFQWFQLPYALLLAVLVGLSVFAPYIGIAVVSVPVVVTVIAQFGTQGVGMNLLVGYVVLQLIDAYVLVPLLFAALVNVGPFYILLSILMFGSIAGFWGVLLAIPLASLCAVALSMQRRMMVQGEVGS